MIFTQAQQHDPSLSAQSNISMAEAVAGAENAKQWMQMQNSGRTAGDKNMNIIHYLNKNFQNKDAARTPALNPAMKTGRRMGSTATCGGPTGRIGRTLKTSARRKGDTWPLSTQKPPTTLSWRGE